MNLHKFCFLLRLCILYAVLEHTLFLDHVLEFTMTFPFPSSFGDEDSYTSPHLTSADLFKTYIGNDGLIHDCNMGRY